jgi:hypothetical protein
MSLFKERAVNARKLINLENTITALKKQLAASSSPSLELEQLKQQVNELKLQNNELRKELTALSVPKKRPGRKKTKIEES